MNLPPVAIPTGILLSPFKTQIEKFFLLETYITSHREYLKRDGFLVRWQPIGEELEVSLSLPSVLDNECTPVSKIAIRRKTSDEPIDQICLLIEAESSVATYQETVTLFNIGRKPVVAALPSIPLRAFFVTDDLRFFESMNDFSVFILEPASSPPQSPHRKCALKTTPNTIDLLNERFEERWGTYWNMAAIDFAIHEKSHWFIYYLVTPKVYYASNAKVPLSASFKRMFRAFVGRPLCWLLRRKWLLKAYFWVPILVFRRKFKVKND